MAKEPKVTLNNGYYSVKVICNVYEVPYVMFRVHDKGDGKDSYFILYLDEVRELQETLTEYLTQFNNV